MLTTSTTSIPKFYLSLQPFAALGGFTRVITDSDLEFDIPIRPCFRFPRIRIRIIFALVMKNYALPFIGERREQKPVAPHSIFFDVPNNTYQRSACGILSGLA